MNHNQSQSTERFYSKTVSDTDGDDVRISVSEPYDTVFIREGTNDHGITLSPQAACNLAVDILEAASVAGSPVARYILGRFQIVLTQDSDDDVLDEDDEDDIDPSERLEVAAGMERLVADMRAAGAHTVGELFAMKQEAANKANTDDPR